MGGGGGSERHDAAAAEAELKVDAKPNATELSAAQEVAIAAPFPESGSSRRLLSRLSFSTAVSALGLLGGLLYIVLRTANAVFYNAFDISPEDVGLGPLDTAVRSASALVYAVIYGAVFIGFGTGVAAVATIRLRRRFGVMTKTHIPPTELVELVLDRLRKRPVSPKHAAMLESSADRAMRRALDRVDDIVRRNPIRRRSLIFSMRVLLAVLRGQFVWGVGIVYSALVLILAFESLYFMPTDSANAVKSGADGRVQWAGFDLLPWGAVRVEAVNGAGGYSFGTSDCYMYLGQANGTAIFYAVKAKETIRVPTSGLTIISHAGSASCPSP